MGMGVSCVTGASRDHARPAVSSTSDPPTSGAQVSDPLSDDLRDDLREQLARRQAVVVVGAGVAVAATSREPTASWLGLLRDGVAYCERVMAGRLPPGWGDHIRWQIDSEDVVELLSAAENVTRRLDGPDGGEYSRWLRESVGSLTVTQPEVIEALGRLGAPIVTTNYDNLIEEVTHLPTVTWLQSNQVQRVLRRDAGGVVHLHGHWQSPESVVLGIRSYEQLLGDEHTQAVQHALAMLNTLVFVGFGAGLADPNFGALRAWLGRVLPGTEYRHFRLGRDGEVADLRAEHDSAERIKVIGYGPSYSDLGPFLRTLAPPTPLSPPALPPPSWCFGREAIVSDLVQALCAERPMRTVVLGPPGVGKSTVCLAAVHHPRVATRFGGRRWFVRCNATTGEGLLAEIATALGIPPGPDRTGQTLTRLNAEPGVLVLDNAETPWEADLEGTEQALLQLASLPELWLLVTVRGDQRPFGVAWRESILVPKLGVADGRRVFLAVAGQRFAGDPHLDELVLAQDGLPLTIGLLANLVESSDSDLSALWRRWQDRRTALLRRGSGDSRQLSAEVSFELSISSPRMTGAAHRLLGLLGVLPDGVAHQDLDLLLLEGGGQGEEAASTLRRVGLAFNEGMRLRVLQPIRDYVKGQEIHRAERDELARAAHHYLDLAATLGPNVGGVGGAEASARLQAERGNLEVMIGRCLEGSNPRPAISAARALGEFMLFSGLGTPRLLEAAAEAAGRLDEVELKANALLQLGDIALRRSDHDGAGKRYQEARRLYERVDVVLGQANCIWGLGNVALRRSQYDTAWERYEQAQRLYEQVEDVRGQAECIWRLGDVALRRSDRRSDHDLAQTYYKKARPLFDQAGDVRGQANCIRGLGNVALKRKEYATAQERFEDARAVYDRVGHVHGVATCIRGFGYIAVQRKEYATARACFEEALRLFERVASVHGRATCIQGLGDIALEYSEEDTARKRYEEGLRLYGRIPEPYGIGRIHQRLARLAKLSDERGRQLRDARDAWNSIARADLVQELDREFDNG
jgi:tetratricopeptide (TPR) repeat protein